MIGSYTKLVTVSSYNVDLFSIDINKELPWASQTLLDTYSRYNLIKTLPGNQINHC